MRFGSVGENVDRLTGAVVLRLHVDARKRKRRPARAGGNAADFAGKHDIGDLRRRRTVRRGIENAGLFAPDRQADLLPVGKAVLRLNGEFPAVTEDRPAVRA